jgi:hypothetical protein
MNSADCKRGRKAELDPGNNTVVETTSLERTVPFGRSSLSPRCARSICACSSRDRAVRALSLGSCDETGWRGTMRMRTSPRRYHSAPSDVWHQPDCSARVRNGAVTARAAYAQPRQTYSSISLVPMKPTIRS